MRFKNFILIESMIDDIKKVANDVIDQYASEERWNVDEIVSQTLDILRTKYGFDDALLVSAEDYLYDYLK